MERAQCYHYSQKKASPGKGAKHIHPIYPTGLCLAFKNSQQLFWKFIDHAFAPVLSASFAWLRALSKFSQNKI